MSNGSPRQAPSAVQRHTLPRQSTPFVGRTEELAGIVALLADPTCRLLTLVGSGGIGKTRLAIEVATQTWQDSAHDVYFVNLQSDRSAGRMVAAITDALQFPLSGQREPLAQLCNYLSDKTALLLLDNFEHLLVTSASPPVPETVEWGESLVELLTAAPGLKVLVTSREALNLQQEWLYPVGGMPFPNQAEGSDKTSAYEAVQLFLACARRVSPSFSLADEEAGVVRICKLVEGMPLALELAASWVKTLSCAEIAAEIGRNVDFLASHVRNIPAHHRSIQAVFDHSWQLLSPQERNAFKRLSVFRGGFSRDAAQHVSDAGLPILVLLLDKSLVQREKDNRYRIHELLRQYGAARLGERADELARISDLHSDYFVAFLRQREQAILGAEQRQVIHDLAADWENIRSAWEWAVEQGRVGSIRQAAFTYSQYCDFQGRFKESANSFEEAIARLSATEPARESELTLAFLYVVQGWNYIRLGRFDQARASFERGQVMYEDLDTEPPPGFGTDPLPGLALLAHIVGDYDRALKLGDKARLKCEIQADKQNLQIAFYALGNAALAQGDYKNAEDYLQQAYTLTQETNNSWMMAYVLAELGNVARNLGHLQQARWRYQVSYRLKEILNDPEGMAAALNHLAQIAMLEEDFDEARRLYQQSLSLYEKIDDRGGLAVSLHGLGLTERAIGDQRAACLYLQRALQIAVDMRFVPLTLSILVSICQELLPAGQEENRIAFMSLALQHRAGDRETKDRAEEYLTHSRGQFPADVWEAAVQRGAAANLDLVISAVETMLDAALSSAPAQEQTATSLESPLAVDQSALIEPLTARELEVLGLMAAGYTNQQIADELIISLGTAKWYSSEIFGKLAVSNRTQAVARARELKLLD